MGTATLQRGNKVLITFVLQGHKMCRLGGVSHKLDEYLHLILFLTSMIHPGDEGKQDG